MQWTPTSGCQVERKTYCKAKRSHSESRDMALEETKPLLSTLQGEEL